jgi:hypothetical protein
VCAVVCSIAFGASAWSEDRVPGSPQSGAAGATDLDAFMARVIEHRDDNWKKLQQYVLDERETFQLIGPGGSPLFGWRREYLWFPRDGLFIRSPLRVDGVEISEADRRKAEADWISKEQRRDAHRDRQDASSDAPAMPDATAPTADGVRQALEPGFVSAAYFLKFNFDPGQYALVGRETLEGRPVVRIEYYPTKLFSEGRTRPTGRFASATWTSSPR